jgi:hypothetical protein
MGCSASKVATGPYDKTIAAEAIAKRSGFAREWAGNPGSTIEKTEERGISIAQLNEVLINIKRRCMNENWKNAPPGGKVAALKVAEVNLYDADKFLIRPATVARKCSFVELIAAKPQPPDWFVSHWWGEAVEDFIACLKQHSKDRCLGFDRRGVPADDGVYDDPRASAPGTHVVPGDGEYVVGKRAFYWVRWPQT